MASFFSCSLAVALGITAAYGGEPYGLTDRPSFEAFLGNRLPESGPALSGNWSAVVAFPNLTFLNPMGLLPMPGSQRLVVYEREGRIYSFVNDRNTSSKSLVLDISAQCQGWDDSGLMGIAFHPAFESNRYLFIYYTYVPRGTVQGTANARPPTDTANRDRLERYTLDENGVAIPGSVVVFIDQRSETVWHNGGGMFFHPQNGFLYLTNGDDARGQNNQRINTSLHSGVLRIDVDRRGGSISHPIPKQPLPSGSSTANYYIPNDNPFVGQPGVLEEFFAIGLRSPHRMTIDPPSGRIFIGDVGDGSREELDIIEPKDPFGLNFQWNRIEGLQGDLVPPFIGVNRRPVLDYPHSEGAAAIIGGYVYRGQEFAAELGGRYVFGDNIANLVWVLDESNVPAKKVLLCNLPRGSGPNSGNDYVGLSGFGYDHQNELYMCQLSSVGGRIYKLQRGGVPAKPLPTLLSQTGAFSDLASLKPADGLIHYEVSSPLWSDGAHKDRWMGIPDGKKIGFKPNGEWTFPAGSVWVKHFELSTNESLPAQRRRLETRVLVRDTNGYVYGASYKWRADLSDADIVHGGLTEDIAITGAQPVGELVSADIGGPAVGSTAKLSEGYQMVAGGTDIWGTSDQFRYAYQQRTGDFDVAVKVRSLTQADLYTKAGLMVRDSLNANARHIFALVFPSNAARNNNDGGYEFQSRDTVGGNAAAIYPSAPSPRVSFPNTWLRLKRAGNTWTAYSSAEGKTWRSYATKTLILPDTIYFGFALTAHVGGGVTSTVNFDFRDKWTQPWFFPGRQDCLSCHSPAAGGVLGVKTRQSNREQVFESTGTPDNQLRAWNHVGYFEPALDESQLPQLLRLTTVTNASASLEMRVRSYLDANCSHCHRPGGPAGQAKWDARIETPLGASQILGGAVLDTLGVAGSRILVPKDLEHSVMYKRLSTATEAYRMPPLAKNVVDQDATSALAAWIQVLTGLPEVSLKSPANGTLFRAPAKVVLTASASTTNGSIAKVEFYQGDIKLGESVSAPYQVSWDLGASGSYEVRALATDTLGVSGSSQTIAFSVINSTANGLLGDYYDNQDFSGLRIQRVDPTVNFDWGNGAPLPGFGPDNFSVRWTGSVIPKYSQTYTFSTTVDDGVRLYVNNRRIIDQWIDQSPTTHRGTITLVAGQSYPIRMEFYENGGGAVAQLKWSSASQVEQIIPSSGLRLPIAAAQPPSVSILRPLDGQMYYSPAGVTVAAEVDDLNGDLAKVEFFVDGAKLGETTDAPFRISWPQPAPGDHVVQVQASDRAGTSTSASVNVHVVPLEFAPPRLEVGGTLLLRAAGADGQRYRLEVSPDLVTWSEVSVQTAVNGSIEFREAIGDSNQFFRVVPLTLSP